MTPSLPLCLFAAVASLAPLVISGADGDLDIAFGAGGKVFTPIGSVSLAAAVIVQPDQKIVMAGYATPGGNRDFCLIRYLPNGQLDPSFGAGGVVTTDMGTNGDFATSLVLMPDGRLLAGGFASTLSGGPSSVSAVVARYLPNGSLDATFATNGKLTVDSGFGTSLLLLPDGKFLAATYSYVSRYLPDGVLDVTFGNNGRSSLVIGPGNASPAVALLPDGGFVVAGSYFTNQADVAVARFSANGVLDATFGSGGVTVTALGPRYDAASAVCVEPDGKIVVTGRTQKTVAGSGDDDIFLARYSTSGQLDPTFGNNGVVVTEFGPDGDYASDIIRLGSGQFLLAGEYRVANDGSFLLARYNADGSLDSTLNGSGFVMHSFANWSEDARALAIQSDGKVLLVGQAYMNGALHIGVMRLLMDGGSSPSALQVHLGGTPLASNAITPVSFGDVAAGGAGSTRTLTLSNAEGEPLTEISVVIAAGSPAFTIVTAPPATLAPGASASLEIRFSGAFPSGSQAAELRIFSSDAQSPFSIALGGTIQPEHGIVITQPPEARLLSSSPGADIFWRFPVTVSNTRGLAMSYQWYKNGAVLAGATQAMLDVMPATALGVYTLKVTTSSGSLMSDPMYVGVLQQPWPVPVEQAYVGSGFDLLRQATVPLGATVAYRWYKDGKALADGGNVTGSGSSRLVVTGVTLADGGVYHCDLTMTAPSGGQSLRRSFSMSVIVNGPPSISHDGSAPVWRLGHDQSPNLSSAGLTVTGAPSIYVATGLPPGVSIDSLTGAISGMPTAFLGEAGNPQPYMVTIHVGSPAGTASVTFPWTVARAADPGDYEGKIEIMSPDPGKYDLGGRVRFTVTERGTVSGTVYYGGLTRPFAGPLLEQGRLSTFAVKRGRGEPPRRLRLNFDPNANALGLSDYTDDGPALRVTRLVVFGRHTYPELPLAARRAVGGAYNLLVRLAGPETVLDPQGEGFLRAEVTARGTVNYVGRLADTSAVSGSALLVANGDGAGTQRVLLHHVLYGGNGAISGFFDIPLPTEDTSDPELTGEAQWVKLPRPLSHPDRSYPLGFSNPYSLTGGKYRPPAPGQAFMNLAPMPAGEANAMVIFEGDASLDIPLEQGFAPVRFAANRSPHFPSSSHVRLFPVGSTGLFRGDVVFRQPDPRNPVRTLQRLAVFNGLCVPGLNQAAGYFTMPLLPTSGPPATTLDTAPILSGKVTIAPR